MISREQKKADFIMKNYQIKNNWLYLVIYKQD